MSRIIYLSCAIALMFACNGKKSTPETTSKKVAEKPSKSKEAKPATPKAAPAKPAASASKYKKPSDPNAIKDDGKVVTVNLGSTDQMKYTFTQIDVPAGRKVKLTLTHLGKLPAVAMGHNFVLLKEGVDPIKFASAGMASSQTDHIAPGSESKIIAKTKLIGGGESETIEFDAPAPGTYSFVCTKPAHANMMNGVFIVK